MATDARNHTAPAAGETPRRQVINDLSMTVNDVIMVANATARTALPATLSSAGFPATAARPIIVRQQDTGDYYEHDGTTWRKLFGPDSIRVQLTSAISGFGAGTYTGLNGFSTDYQTGVTSTFTHSAGLVTVNRDGLYTATANAGGTVTGGNLIEMRLQTGAGRILCRAVGPATDTIVSMTATEQLTSGTSIRLWLYNGAGTFAAPVDSSANPFGFTVTRWAGS